MNSVSLHIMRGSGRLNPFVSKIEGAAYDAAEKIQNRIDLPEVDIVIADDPERAIPETGVGGHMFTANFVLISINPEFQDIEKAIGGKIQGALAHELYHCARTQHLGLPKALFETLIWEGLAGHFDIEINDGDPNPWDRAVEGKELEDVRKRAESEYDNEDYDHSAWFFGSEEKGIPRWAGYTLGFELVRQYLNRTNKSASDLVDVESGQFKE